MIKGKFHRRLVLTLSIFSLVPMILLTCVNSASFSALLQEEISNAIFLLQEQAREKWDNNMKGIQKDALKYMLDSSNINAFANRTDPEDFYLTNYLREDISRLKANNPYIKDIVMYIQDIDFVMNYEGSMRSDFYFEKSQNSGLKELLLQPGFWNISYLDQYRTTEDTFDAVLLQSGLPLWREDPNVFMGVVVDRRDLLQDIEKIQYLDSGQTFIVDRGQGIPIVSYPEEVLEWEEVKGCLEDAGEKTEWRIRGEKWLCISQESTELEWTYLTIVPFSEVTSHVRQTGWTAFWMAMVCVVMILGFTFFFGNQLYVPVERLYRKVGEGRGEEAGKTGRRSRDEFSRIHESIDKMILENKDMQAGMLKAVAIMQQGLLKDLLAGMEEAEARQKLDTYGLVLPHRYFVVMLFCGRGKELDITRIRCIFQESFMNYYLVPEPGDIVVLLNYNEGNPADCIAGLVDCPCAVSQGVVYGSLAGIAKSYHQAQYAMQYRTFQEKLEYLTLPELLKADYSQYKLPVTFRDRYRNCVEAGNPEAAYGLVEDLVQVYFRENVPVFFLEKAYEELYSFAEDMARNYRDRWEEVFSETDRLRRREQRKYSLDAYAEDIRSMYGKLFQLQGKMQGSRDGETFARVKDLIQERYQEDISLEMIADELDLPYSFVSRLFKKQMGEGFVEYLTRIRIGHAVELLADRSLSIDTISKRVGYVNTPTFIRNFKKMKGVSPGRYRNMEGWKKDVDGPSRTDSTGKKKQEVAGKKGK